MVIGDRNVQFSLSKNMFLLSRSYFYEDDTTWCVHRAKQMPSWMNIFYIASLDIIILGIILLLSTIFFTYILSSFEDHPRDIWTSILINIQVVVLFPSRFKPKRWMLRFFFASGILLMLALTTIFLAFYNNFVLQPRYAKQIDTFDQIVKNKYRLAGDEYAKAYLMQRNAVNRKLCKCNQSIANLNK